jgi:regulator of protease activity HflC (stomatin/prohibitin superfamily)
MALILVLSMVVAVLAIATVRVVPHGHAWTIERFGRYHRTAGPGLSYLIPIAESVGHKVDMCARALAVPGQQVQTRDEVPVKIESTVYFQVVDAAKASYAVADLEQALATLTATEIRIVVGAVDLHDALCDRDALNARLRALVAEPAGAWGVEVERVEIRELQPPSDVVDSLFREMQAERERRKTSPF